MPQIREYVSQESAQTALPGRRMSASDINVAPDNAGQGLMNVGLTLAKVVEEQEVSDIQAKLAKARAAAGGAAPEEAVAGGAEAEGGEDGADRDGGEEELAEEAGGAASQLASDDVELVRDA